jgi:large subunit ribosomal protein L21
MSFAVIKTGGKQYLVSNGDTITIEKMNGDFSVGSEISFDEVLLRHDGNTTEIGTPMLSKKVTAEIVEIGKLPTIEVVKYRSKSRYFKKNGHRQPFFKVKISSI